jgi:drug/metabolite transporter (DMT)-like permease
MATPTPASTPSISLHRHMPLRAIALWCLGALLFTAQSGLLKWLSGDFHFSEILFVRSFVVVLGTSVLLLHVVRFLCFSTAIACFIQSVRDIPLADATAVTFAAPLLMTALSVPLLGEKVGLRRWTAVIVGMGGVLVIANPSTGIFEPAALWALGSALAYALAINVTRKLTGSDPAVVIVWSMNAFYIVLMPIFAPFVWTLPSWDEIALMLACGVIVLVAQMVAVHACSLAPPQVLAPFDYTGMLWAVVIGFLVWGDVPSLTILIGAAILIGSGIYILWREAQVARAARHAQSASSES